MKTTFFARSVLGIFSFLLLNGTIASVACGALALVAPPTASGAAASSPTTPAAATTNSPTFEPPRVAAPATLDPKIAVTKIHEVRNDESYHPHHNDALAFEKEYWNYGAVTEEQKEACRGQIYVISWKNGGLPDRFVTRFEYRQQNSRETIKVQSDDHPEVSGNARSIFKVVGEEYRKDGPVLAWRFVVVRNNQIVAEERSLIW